MFYKLIVLLPNVPQCQCCNVERSVDYTDNDENVDEDA